jgi:hypothetical protein
LSSIITWYENRERAVMFDYDTKEKEHQNTRQSDLYSEATPPPRTNQIASCFGALYITGLNIITKCLIHGKARGRV